MIDRRGFVARAVAGFGGAMLLPTLGLAGAVSTVDYRRIGLRWSGGRVMSCDGDQLGGFVAFAPTRDGAIAGGIDLFEVGQAAPGDVRDHRLVPLGRCDDLAAAHAAIRDAVRTRIAAGVS